MSSSRIQKVFKISSVVFLVVSLLCFYVSFKVEAKDNYEFTVQDQMGTTYEFNHRYDVNDVYWNMTAYSGRPLRSGTIYNVSRGNLITQPGDNCMIAIYVQTDGSLHAKILAATWVHATYAFKEINLDRDIDSIAANQVRVLKSHKFGAEVSWINSKGVEKYAIFELWHGKVEEGDLADYKGGVPVTTYDQGDVTGPISGKSVVLVLDSSGSMSGDKIKKAKSQVRRRVKKLSEDDEVALFIFEGCGDVPLIQGFTQNHNTVIQGLSSATAQGGSSPVAESIQVGMQYLLQSHHGQKGELTIYTDGGENCQGDPVAAASQVKVSTFPIDFSIVGYNVSKEDQKELKEIAKAGGGDFDKEKVWESEKQKGEAETTQDKAGAMGLAAFLASISSYMASGGFDLSNLFGSQGLFSQLFKGGGIPSTPAASATEPAPSSVPPSGTSAADLKQLERWRKSIERFKGELKDALERGDKDAAERAQRNLERYAKELDARQKQLGQKGEIDLSTGVDNLNTDAQIRSAMQESFNNYADISQGVEDTRVTILNNIGKMEIKFIDSFRDPLNPYHVIPHKDVNTFIGMRDDAKTVADQINNWKEQIKNRDQYYEQFRKHIEDYKNREGIRDIADDIDDNLKDLQNIVNK